ncbi:Uu.00g064720.m01.CDS01 [Anthostomella pinea]|uniref:Cutinase n=1 Tax=Anthostomella pinea TaxID=933095 RepID=A0AAI8YKQ1_9PEZI|nr:Uu.00g064720.m01.CDS01 [Anthostomella pinea]
MKLPNISPLVALASALAAPTVAAAAVVTTASVTAIPIEAAVTQTAAAAPYEEDIVDLLFTRTDLEDAVADTAHTATFPELILIYARGSLEPGNLGLEAGPELSNALETHYGDASAVWIQGVGYPYIADLVANFLPDGTTQAAIAEAARLFALAQVVCPGTPVVAGGYSQGTAVITNALSNLPPSTQDQIKGAVLFGYTHNTQNHGAIPDFPSEKTKVYCLPLDAVCDGTLFMLPDHFLYEYEAAVDAGLWLGGRLGW